MKALLLGGVLLLWSLLAGAQVPFTVPDSATFYTFMDSARVHVPPDTFEASDYRQLQRLHMTWGPRLAPTGHMSRANDAMLTYARAYHGIQGGVQSLPIPSAIPPEYPNAPTWTELGPIEPVLGSAVSRTFGMGQIHRIAFDPAWNGTTNQTVYAGSHYGGLFRSDDGGQQWYNYHTDRGLALTSVGGVAVSNSHVFVVTGNGDQAYSSFGRWVRYEPLRGRVNDFSPLHTQGVYRASTQGPVQWEGINGQSVTMIDGSTTSDLLSVFAAGGTMREIIVHPSNNNVLLIATSQGIFRTANGGNAWTQVLVGPPDSTGGYLLDPEWRGLVFHPTNPDTVYASGRDVYVSSDGGLTWTSMTGGQSLTAEVNRINLAVTPAAPDRLYAHVNRDTLPESGIYWYNGTTWQLSAYITSLDNRDAGASWLGIAVSPREPSLVHIGARQLRFSDAVDAPLPSPIAVTPFVGHDDVHVVTYPPNGDTLLYIGTHGGVSRMRTSRSVFDPGENLYNGLAVATIWSFDDWEGNDSTLLLAQQDVSLNYTFSKGQQWTGWGGGDGYGVRIDDQSKGAYIKLNQYEGYRQLEPGLPPLVHPGLVNQLDVAPPAHPGDVLMIGNTFAGLNHPKTDSMYVGFNELYVRHRLTVPLSAIIPDTSYSQIYSGVTIYDAQGQTISSTPSNYTYSGYSFVASVSLIICPGTTNQRCTQEDTIWTVPQLSYPNSRRSALAWGNRSDLYLSRSSEWDRRITDIAFSEEEGTDYTYLVTMGDHGEFWNEGRRGDLYRADASVCDTCFVLLTDHLPIDSGAIIISPSFTNQDPNPITGLAIDPLNSDRVWVSFSGYAQDIKVWYSEDAGNSWQTYDDSTGSLAALNLPINGIVYQRGTNDRLYIATDAGVYVREAGGAWLRYGENIPNVRVTELKINYCLGKLRAATFGRGVWENELLPVEDGIARRSFRTVSNSEVWEADKHMSRDLRILSGASLHLNNMTLNMPKNGLIVVEPGAELIVNGSTLTNGCGQGWQGIEVWGQTSGQQDGSEGILVLTNSTLEHAKEAVRLWEVGNFPRPDGSGGTGGTVIATNTRFVNNWRSAEFMRYQSGGQERSAFTRCTFTVNDEHRQGFLGHLSAWDIAGLQIKGCTFKDQRTNKVGDAYGIYTLRASVHLTAAPTTPQQLARNNRFEGLSRGIEIGSDPTRFSWVIDQSDFLYNWKGAVVRADAGVRVLRSEFKMSTYGNQSYTYGLGLLRQGAFVVEQNEFIQDDQTPSGFPSLGIWVDDTKSGYNRLRRNYFEELPIGVLVNGDNGDDGVNIGSGMQLWCNEHVENAYDVSIFNDPTDPYGASVSINQGDNDQPAKNIFSYPLQPFQGQDWHIYNDASGMATVNYWIPPNAAQQEIPTDVVNVTRMTSNLPGSLNFCVDYYTNIVIPRPQIGGEPMSLADLKQEYYTALAECQSEESKVPCDSAVVAMKAQAVSYWAGEVVYYYQNDTLGPNWDSTHVWLQKIPGLLAQYDLVEHYWNQNRYTDALDYMNTIASAHLLSGAALNNHTDYVDLLDLLYGTYQDNRNEALLSREEVDLLRIIADNNYGFAAQYAANIINFFYAREYIYHPALPQGEEEALQEPPLLDGKLAVFPNPSHTWADVQYELPESQMEGTLLITAVNGRVIQEINLSQVNGQVKLNTKDWIPGVYFIALVTDNTLQHQMTLIVRR